MGFYPDEFKTAYSSALNLLSICDRSVKDLRERLSQKGFTEGSVNKVISKLLSEGYINDELFAYKFTYEAVKRKKFGPDLIKQGLKEKGINKEITDEAVSRIFKEYDEKDIARKALGKRLSFRGKKLEVRSKKSEANPAIPPFVQGGGWGGDFRGKELRKLSDYLRRRGFSYDIIRDTIREIEKEYDI
ncbi:MAG: regulatory protein RecX [Nitrospirae bacterium]|nr:regulatory protein RecX [Nitrospirota bacterium]